jgi:flagellin
VQFSNGTLSPDDQDAVASEVLQLGKEMKNIVGQTQFNGKSLFGSGASFNFQVGANDGETVSIAAIDLDPAASGAVDADNDNVYGEGTDKFADGLYAVFTGGSDRTVADIKAHLAGVDTGTVGSYADGLQQAATSMLAQANQAPQNVLSLLKQ